VGLANTNNAGIYMTEDRVTEAELPLETSGARLLRAREAAGFSRAQIAASTKIPERHLIAIENGNLAALPARTYAVGFSRSYARAVGIDEEAIVADVRSELEDIQPENQRRNTPAFEPGDPARIPGARLAWLAAAGGLLAVAGLGYVFWPGMVSPGGDLPSILPSDAPSASASVAGQAVPPAASGPVVLTATTPQVWIKVVDAAGNQLFQKELAQGESYTVPADQPDVFLSVAKPDALAITIGGQPVAGISQTRQVMRNVPIAAAALQARGAATPATGAPVAIQQAPRQPEGLPRRSDRREIRSQLRPQVSNLPTRVSDQTQPASVTPAPDAAAQPVQPGAPTADR
jgi:cytoskeleton protein RodZ